MGVVPSDRIVTGPEQFLRVVASLQPTGEEPESLAFVVEATASGPVDIEGVARIVKRVGGVTRSDLSFALESFELPDIETHRLDATCQGFQG